MAFQVIFRAFGLAAGQLSDPGFRRVFLIGIGLAVALLVGFTAGLSWLIEWLTPEEAWLPILGEVTWLNDLLSWGALFLLGFLSIFMMVPVASAITSMFLDDVANAVEAVHYPHLPPTTPVPFSDALRDTVNFMGVLIGANLVAIILYVMFAPLAVFIFWGLNGFLLGREYYTMAAIRHVGRTQARVLRRRNAGTIWLAGILMAMPLSVPLLNLLIPILGAATFTHLFQLLPKGSDVTNAQHLQR